MRFATYNPSDELESLGLEVALPGRLLSTALFGVFGFSLPGRSHAGGYRHYNAMSGLYPPAPWSLRRPSSWHRMRRTRAFHRRPGPMADPKPGLGTQTNKRICISLDPQRIE